jgi:hypothetical protein
MPRGFPSLRLCLILLPLLENFCGIFLKLFPFFPAQKDKENFAKHIINSGIFIQVLVQFRTKHQAK